MYRKFCPILSVSNKEHPDPNLETSVLGDPSRSEHLLYISAFLREASHIQNTAFAGICVASVL